ncbi:MAG: hypothetical protein M1482_08295, partial [Chloroflexi bacterium]|nr:hypothetical protein [Chloroflexota bacterium]
HTSPPAGGKYAAWHNLLTTASVELHDVLNTRLVHDVLTANTYNLQAFKFDSSLGRWVRLRLGYVVRQQLSVVQPQPQNGLEGTYALGAEDIPAVGRVRLVVVGWGDPTNVEGSRIAAFKDIQIVAH